jgi:hypothetical protein
MNMRQSVLLLGAVVTLLCGCSLQKSPGNAPGTAVVSREIQKVAGTRYGVIGDSMCASRHAGMIKAGAMGKTDESCTVKCVEAGSKYVLVTDKDEEPWQLSNQSMPRRFAGKKVRVDGDINEPMHYIKVEQILLEQPDSDDHK